MEWSCEAWTGIESWEPGAFFGAEVLTKTHAHFGIYYGMDYTGRFFARTHQNYEDECWANPDTFIPGSATTWYETACQPITFEYYPYGEEWSQSTWGADRVVDATYFNENFIDPTQFIFPPWMWGSEYCFFTWVNEGASINWRHGQNPTMGTYHQDTGEGAWLIIGIDQDEGDYCYGPF